MAESLGGSLPTSVDTLVIGAGLAGLALGRRLALSDSDRHVLLLDGRSAYRDDRTWCFWAPPEHDLRHLVSHEWHRWRYDDGATEHVHRVPGRSYQMIRGADFYADARRVIAADPFVHLVLGTAVLAVRPAPSPDGDPRVAVTTPSGTVVARHVVDTRPHPTPALLFQCFAGSEIDHGGTLAAEDTTVAGLMTRMRVDDQGFVFTYVLPMTPTTALVELTRFSRRPLPPRAVVVERDAELTAMGLAGATTLRQEGGVLPMGPLGPGPDLVEGVVRAGGSGGGLRRATGYAFQRIQAWAADCAVRMARGEPPVGHPEDGWVQQQMDRIFLQALRGRPERTPEYFLALAGGVAPDRLLRFLTDRATPVDLAAIIASLPLTPFLAQVPDRRRAVLAEHAAVVGATAVTPDRLHR